MKAKAFTLKIPDGAIARSSFAPDGTYIPIIHNQEKEWDGVHSLKVCHHKNLGNFFDKTCPTPVDTMTPLADWKNTELTNDEFRLSTMTELPPAMFAPGYSHILKQIFKDQLKLEASQKLSSLEKYHTKDAAYFQKPKATEKPR
jgi:hypothetical protein